MPGQNGKLLLPILTSGGRKKKEKTTPTRSGSSSSSQDIQSRRLSRLLALEPDRKRENTMRTSLPLLLLFSLLLLLFPYSQSSDLPGPARPVSRAHAELTTYGFPIGLLPADVRGYAINATSGDFSVDLHGPCRLTLPPDNYLAAYSEKITGRIVRGRIAGLDGIRVRAFFRWWSITGIKSSGENLVFEVGGVSAKYPSKNFDEAPACEGRKQASS